MGRLALLIAPAAWPQLAAHPEARESIRLRRRRAKRTLRRTAEQVGSASQIDWEAVEAAMRRSGAARLADVFKFVMPRTDLNVTSAGVPIAPALALGSWLAFKPRNETQTVAMGDLVLTEEEYNRVVARLKEGGVSQTAVHKHLPEMSPPIWWTHIHAEGDPEESHPESMPLLDPRESDVHREPDGEVEYDTHDRGRDRREPRREETVPA